MKYKIMEVKEKVKVIQEGHYLDGYGRETETYYKLKEPECYDLKEYFESVEEAYDTLKREVREQVEAKDRYRRSALSKTFTIIPIIEIDYEGEER